MASLGGAETVATGAAELLQTGVEGGAVHGDDPPQRDQADVIVRAVLAIQLRERLIEATREVYRDDGERRASAL